VVAACGVGGKDTMLRTWHDRAMMRRAIYAALVACVLTVVPNFILELHSETLIVNSLKTIAAALGAPGAFVAFIAAFGRIDDIDLWVTDIANLAFYLLVTVVVAQRLLISAKARNLNGLLIAS
jgi:uncharacterized membrane protein